MIEYTGMPDWDGNSKWVVHISSSYRKASQWLLDNGFEIYTFKDYRTEEFILGFHIKVVDLSRISAKIIEMDVDID